MGRSVSYASGAVAVAYRDVSWMNPDELYDWEDMIDWVQSEAAYMWDMTPTEKWLGREDKAVAENDFAYVGVSEYCGLMSIWLVPKDDSSMVHTSWCKKITDAFYQNYSELRKLGTFSNGGAIFEKIKEVQDVA